MIVYVDTSAAMKLLVEEKESAALADALQRHREGGGILAASLLLHTELRGRPGARSPSDAIRSCRYCRQSRSSISRTAT